MDDFEVMNDIRFVGVVELITILTWSWELFASQPPEHPHYLSRIVSTLLLANSLRLLTER